MLRKQRLHEQLESGAVLELLKLTHLYNFTHDVIKRDDTKFETEMEFHKHTLNFFFTCDHSKYMWKFTI